MSNISKERFAELLKKAQEIKATQLAQTNSSSPQGEHKYPVSANFNSTGALSANPKFLGETPAEKLARIKARYLPQPSAVEQTSVARVTPELTEVAEAAKTVAGTIVVGTPSNTLQDILEGSTDKYGNLIKYNEKQAEFVTLASSGASCVLIGAAGTGKTTCMKGTVQALLASGKIPKLESDGHKHLVNGAHGIVIVAYTRRAVNNIRKNMPADMQDCCITIHKLLEYAPVRDTIIDPTTGEEKNTFQFLPSRNSLNPLPSTIHTIIFEESSMIGTPLYQEVIESLPHNPQQIFLGDICQLAPVFGPAILGFKLTTLPVVELTEVYRQALESPIIRLAHRILSGQVIPKSEFEDWKVPNQLTLHPWKKSLHADIALLTLAKFFEAAITSGNYDPEEDMILIPFNKSCGTIELNKHIANFIARTRKAITYEVIAGFNKHYFSVGDKCMYEKEDCIIQNIESNVEYAGATPQKPSPNLDYWGHLQLSSTPETPSSPVDEMTEDEVDFLLAQVASVGDEDRVRAASHKITLLRLDSGTEITIDKASEVNALDLGYALTVHKSQGSEWRKVFCCFHQSHATALLRELLYTAVTRAREELYVICEPDTFEKGIRNQKIKGNTLAEKAEYFKGKYSAEEIAKYSATPTGA